tara:strand:- start:2955 stop:4817 length:1863 start_codon:yes stop_codon:yes gene_type:complete
MPLTKFVFRPGINREGTDYDNEGGWFDVNLVRFKNGRPQKIGGWEKLINETYLGTARALKNWISLSGSKYLGIGTNLKYYVLEGTEFNDVTPIRKTSNNTVTFSATDGSSTITVTDSNHGAVTEDFVTLSGAVGLGGNINSNVLNQEYQILTVPSVNTYTISAKNTSGVAVTANSSDTGNGGSSVDGAYQINVGLDVYVSSTGWGVGTWGANTWGSATPLLNVNQLRLWSHDNYGEDLIMNVRAGGIYRWVENDGTATRAVELATTSGANLVPTVGLQILTSEKDRHLIVLGADPISGNSRTGSIDPMLIAFSDQEDPLQFEPLSTNTAGSLRLSSGSQIIGSVKARQEILVWTDTALYSMQFIGPPFTFGINLINESTGLIGPNAAITAPTGVFWMSYDNFYVYTGAVKKVPCSVLSYVFDDFNSGQGFKVFAFSNTQFDEVGWYYASASSTEIDRYVTYNYAENVWSYGQLERTAWLDTGVQAFPVAAKDNYLYQHETGFNDDGNPMTNVFIESSDFDLGDGEQFAFVNRVIPDLKFLDNSDAGQVNMVLKTRNFPGDSLTTNSTNIITSTTKQSHVRARARQMVLRLESNDDAIPENTDTGWRLGATRFDVKPDGRR